MEQLFCLLCSYKEKTWQAFETCQVSNKQQSSIAYIYPGYASALCATPVLQV